MTELEELQELLDNDPEVQLLAGQVHERYDDLRPKAKTILYWRNESSSPDLPIKKLFAYYKCALSWAVLINKIWNTICGRSFLDHDKDIHIPGTTKKMLMYHYSPLQDDEILFNLASTDDEMPTLSIREEVDVLDSTKPGQRDQGTLYFKLEEPKYTIGNSGNIIVDLPNSEMSISLSDEDPIIFKVKDFTPSGLVNFVASRSLRHVNY